MENDWSFQDEIKLKQIDLARAALYLAKRVTYPQLSVPNSLKSIAALAEEAAQKFSEASSIEFKGTILSEFLFREKGFSGNREAYYDPRNSFLNDVLQRRQGIPISLSVLYISVARQLKIPAYGVGMPGHFVVMVPDGNKRLLFDPFNGGGRLSLNDCVNLVEQTTGYSGAFEPHWLDPVSEKLILTRMLANLRASYVEQSEWTQAIRVLECLQLLNPDDPTLQRDLGVLHYQQGAFYKAATQLEQYAKQDPDASDLPFIKKGISERMTDWVKQN